MKKADTPSVHLEMIRKYLDYLSLRRGNVDWKNPIAAIDQMTRNMEEGRDVIAEFDSKSIIPVTDLVGF